MACEFTSRITPTRADTVMSPSDPRRVGNFKGALEHGSLNEIKTRGTIRRRAGSVKLLTVGRNAYTYFEVRAYILSLQSVVDKNYGSPPASLFIRYPHMHCPLHFIHATFDLASFKEYCHSV